MWMRQRTSFETPAKVVALRVAFAVLIVTSLVAGSWGGLVRAGAHVPTAHGVWLSQAVVGHAFLMVCCFLGTAIGIERAVAIKKSWAYLAPVTSGVSGLTVLGGAAALAAWLAVCASAVFVFANLVVIGRQRAAHTVLLLVGGFAWLLGCLLHATGPLAAAVVPLWLSFLVLTIAAERLEMTRLMRRQPGALPLLSLALTAVLSGAVMSGVTRGGGIVFGAGLVALSLWLLAFDIARRTLFAHGLSRYMAICLLFGYVWLLVSGVAWVGSSLGLPWRDAALHALALGFVFSMIFGHAPVILPAVARVKLEFSASFYFPLALLHGSLALRLLAPHLDGALVRIGASLNAAAIGLFAVVVLAAAIQWRRGHRTQRVG